MPGPGGVVPWCDPCRRYFAPNALEADGTCPRCGSAVAVREADEASPYRAPWHFKLMVAALVLYLGFRAWQGIDWIVHHV
jgi:uncharacterized paraquat-inducible protein A